MDFGNVDSLEGIDFKLPSDHSGSYCAAQQKDYFFYLSLPVWGDENYIGKIYPIGTPKDDYLKIFTQNFNAIELNSSFYGTPRTEAIKKWKKDIPKDFKFSIKVPRSISHEGLDINEFLYFIHTIKQLGDNLGNVFLQLPPNFSPINAKELILFLEQVPKETDLFIEFRHSAWFKEGLNSENFFRFMTDNHFHMVLTDVAGKRDVLAMRPTSSKVLIRFKGYELVNSDFTRLDEWVDRLASWKEKGINEIYFYLHQQDQSHGIDLAEYLIPKLNSALNIDLSMPKRVQNQEQISLF